MAKIYSGLVDVRYSTDAFSGDSTTVTGKITADSTITPTAISSETTQGILYGGDSFVADIGFYDHASYAALRTAMRADTAYTWRFTLVDGTTMTTRDPINPIVEQVPNPNKRDGLSPWRLKLEFYSDDGDLIVA